MFGFWIFPTVLTPPSLLLAVMNPSFPRLAKSPAAISKCDQISHTPRVRIKSIQPIKQSVGLKTPPDPQDRRLALRCKARPHPLPTDGGRESEANKPPSKRRGPGPGDAMYRPRSRTPVRWCTAASGPRCRTLRTGFLFNRDPADTRPPRVWGETREGVSRRRKKIEPKKRRNFFEK